MDKGKVLLKLSYGEKVFEEVDLKEQNPNFNLIEQKAKQLNGKKIPWHHHLLFPQCIFNAHKGEWCIFFEDPETREETSCFFKNEPKNQLARIEKLFYEQKE